MQHEREKVIEAERVSKNQKKKERKKTPALRLPHISTFVLELCQCHCAQAWWVGVGVGGKEGIFSQVLRNKHNT